MPVLQQDILGFDVSMDDALPVSVVERGAHLAREGDRVGNRKLLLACQARAQRLTLDIGHDVVQERAGLARIVERKDVGVLQIGRGLDLGEEPLGADDGGQLGAQHLYRHTAVVTPVLGQVDRGHPALAELPLEQVALLERIDETNRNEGYGTAPGVWLPRIGAAGRGR